MTAQQPPPRTRLSRRDTLGLFGAASVVAIGALGTAAAARPDRAMAAPDPSDGDLADRIRAIIAGTTLQNAHWAMRFGAPGTGPAVYELNPNLPVIGASADKVYWEGTAFSALGPGYRFRTPVFRTGPIVDGVLHGDLVLVASGDLLLSGRLRPDGTLRLPTPDHTYSRPQGGSVPIGRDPLQEIRRLAEQVAARGIRRVDGGVLVDTSLFVQTPENIGTGATVPISPMMINDNIVDVKVTPGAGAGAPATVDMSPRTGYVTVLNKATTADATTGTDLRFTNEVTNPDGTQTVELTGTVSVAGGPVWRSYWVPSPARFAQTALVTALRDAGVQAEADLLSTPDTALSRFYTRGNTVAQHLSPPLQLEAEPMMKISSDLHVVAFGYLIGAIAGHSADNAHRVGQQIHDRVLSDAGLDPAAAETSETFTTFLGHLAGKPYSHRYRDALPILGVDGDLATMQAGTPAAGHVYAKTGGGTSPQPIGSSGNNSVRALAGYLVLPDGRWAEFGAFVSFDVPGGSHGSPEPSQALAALAAIASLVYEALARARH
jgi:PBP4 family serine-type D-alanyl-D-alanine carboxypeptidase